MNTHLIKLHHENFTKENEGNKDQFFVNFVAFCKVSLWLAILALPAFGAEAAVVFTTLYSFTATNDGANPAAALVQGGDGYFYGITEGGGTNGYGNVFQISAAGALTSLYSFNGTNDGMYPMGGGLAQGSDGNLYGTTGFGAWGFGTVFRISTTGLFTNLYSFTGGSNSAFPFAGLMQGSDGNLYGTTYGGINGFGNNGFGGVFKISTNGALISFYSFTGGNDGTGPLAGLVQSSEGNFFGTTYYGGTNGYGTVFELNTNGAPTSLYSFTGSNDGKYPLAGLVQGSDGSFYGTTSGGGSNNYGTVFKISTNGEETNLYSFTGPVVVTLFNPYQGGFPSARLLQGSDGSFYGTTAGDYRSGDTNYGTVFRITTNGLFTSLYSFTGGNGGKYPLAALVQGSDGSFYGTTYAGGASGLGTVFRLTIVPEFQGATISNEWLNLTWSTEAGGTYQLQYTSDLTSTNWINSAFVATGPSMTASDWVFDSPQRFYRLRIIIAPEGAFDCVASGTQSNYVSFVKGLQALAATYNLGATLQSVLGGGTSLQDVMTLDPNGCVIAYCNANPQFGCFLAQTSSSCTIDGALPAGLPVIAWGGEPCGGGPHVFNW